MKLTFIIAGATLIGASGLGIYSLFNDFSGHQEKAPTPSQNTPQVVLPTQTATASPVPYTPTLNAPATVAAMNMTAAADGVIAARIQADAIIFSANAENTRAAEKAHYDAIRAEKSEAGQNYRAELALTQTAADADRARAEAEIIRAETEARRLEQDAQNRWIGVGVVLLSVLVGMAFLRSLILRKSSEDDEIDELPDTPAADTWPAYAAGVRTSLFSEIVSRDVLRQIGRAVMGGRPFSHAQIVRGMGIVSEQVFDELQGEFINRGLAKWRNAEHHKQGVIVMPKGFQFFAEIGAGTPPPATSSAIPAISAAQDTIRHDFQPILEGVGDE